MSSDPDVPALQRFGRDLRRIREDRDVTRATVHTHTQAPESQIQSFEAGTLYEESTMNPVYLRAFVRAYAEAVDLPPHAVLDQLEAALSGNYQNQLAVQYLDVPSSASKPDSSTGQPDAASREDEQETTPRGSSTDEETDSGGAKSTGREHESGKTEGESETPDPDPEDETVSTASTTESGGTLWSENRGASLAAIAGLFLMAVVGALINIYLGEPERAPNSPSKSSARTVASADQSSPDTLAAADTAEIDERPQQASSGDIALGDTLHVTVYATADVRELRVQQDDDLRRPYWIREGEAAVFPFARQITLQNQLDSLRLLVERYPYPVSRTDDEGRIVITRDKVQRFLDTLRAAPTTVPSSPDTIRGTVAASEADSL
ncbi:MAG: hypothetical protein BRD43_04920 [Bacteroidetes bacterium QS_4_64_154]|nr:MAG: hypothetical protein BRD43_04920 [Bacteroidetes bacterium QS_4_64_154]